jgi:hypothetical protein
MRYLFFLMLLVTVVSGCKKNTGLDTVVVDLTIISTNTPPAATQGHNILSNIKCSGTDLCYKFLRFDIKETGTRQFEIKVKATYPNSKKGDIVCAQAIYYVDTSITINAATKGQYILNFYNNNTLFKADTIQVN